MHEPTNTLRRASVLGLALTCATSALRAEAITTDDATSQELLPYVVVASPRFIDKDVEVASRVQLIDRSQIEDSGATNVVELLKQEANIHFRSTSGNSALSEVSLGGFGEGSGQRVLVLLDGHRLNTADLGQINWLSIPLSLIESIEVIKGAQSAIYGNNAVGGVIKITTVQPSEALAGQFQLSGGSFDSYNARLGLSGRVGSFGFSAHAEHDETNGYRQNSQYDADGGGIKFDWLANDWVSAYLSVSGVESEYGLPGPLSRAELADDRKQSKEFANFGEEEAIYSRAGIGLFINDEFSFGLDAGYSSRDLYTVFYSYGGGAPAFPFEIEQDYEILSASPTVTYQNDRLTALVGLDYYDDHVGAEFGTDPVEYERQSLAAFSSLKYDAGEGLILTASLRCERARTDGSYSVVGAVNELDALTEDQYAWSLGVIKAFEQNGRLYASVRRFYRYAATDEVTVVDFNSSTASFNPDLDTEWGHELELGGDWAFDSLVVGARIYRQWMNDEIIYSPSSFSNVNLDETSRFGTDLFVTYALTEKLNANVNYTYVSTEIVGGTFDGSEVPLVPAHKLRVAMEYRPSNPVRILLGASYTDNVYVGSDFDNASSELNNYVLVDLSVRYSFSDDVSVFVTVNNLFDKEYVSTAFGPDALYPGVGRSAKAGVTLSF
ncbi:TonB-dependent receptor [Opitutales bacterium]|nr:TonB-dependent receptor [Opitutales bacterium]